jgi:isopropylmalate/homocitrate/citramalate synthase
MELPRVFRDDEITRFQQELADRRRPGAYLPGHWSVSPLNRDPAVTGRMPEQIRLRDATLRSVETLPGVVASDAAKAAYLRQLVRSGVSEVVTAGVRGRDEQALRAEIEIIKSENPDCRAICPLVSSPETVSLAHAAGYDGVQVWLQGFGEASLIYERIYAGAWQGEDWRDPGLPRRRAEFVARAARLVEHARGLGMRVATPLLMVSYLTAEMLEETCAALTAAGATELTLFDGPGAMSPEAFGRLVAQTRALAPQAEVGLHPHNTFGLAVGCAVAAARAGADVIELSVNGYCGGPGNADLAATALAFEALYGVRTGIDLGQLTALARAGEALTGYHVAWNHPVTGRQAFGWGGMDIITQETVVDPLLHNCIEPSLVGNERQVPLTLDSGGYTMAYVLGRLGIEITSTEQVDEVLRRCHAMMRSERRLLTDDDIRGIAASVRPSPAAAGSPPPA